MTDADLVLGRIDPTLFSGGRIGLDTAGARTALESAIGARLALSPELAAFGVVEMVDNNMASAARVHAIESGVDVAGRTLIAFGGAAPLHAARLPILLGIDRVLIPECAGRLLRRLPAGTHRLRDRAFRHARLAHFDAAAANRSWPSSTPRLRAVVQPPPVPAHPSPPGAWSTCAMAWPGHEIAVELPPEGEIVGDTLEAFGSTYERQYDRRIPGVDVETISRGARLPLTPVRAAAPPAGTAERHRAAPAGRRQVFAPVLERMIEVAVHDRATLRPGAAIEGPAIIVEAQTSTVVPEGFDAFVDGFGHIELARGPAAED
ncbi:MAG: hydantoinase/oxoprolinase family protein [Geminicoccaceae bacterium]